MKVKKYILGMILILLILCTYSFATVNTSEYASISANNGFSGLAKPVIAAFRAMAVVTAIACMSIIGIRFMIASPEQKAELKSSLTPYMIGAVMAFAMVPILSILYNIFSK